MNALPDLPDLDERVRRLRGPLLAELRPRRRRVPARELAVAAVAVVALLVAGLSAREPALAVERQDGWLVLRIEDATAGEDELTRELVAAGIPGEVRTLPVPAENVGTWAVISELAGPGGESVVRLNRIVYERETLRIPVADVRDTSGKFLFYVGREAKPGERLWWDGEHGYKP